jgi:hypothetical protein
LWVIRLWVSVSIRFLAYAICCANKSIDTQMIKTYTQHPKK